MNIKRATLLTLAFVAFSGGVFSAHAEEVADIKAFLTISKEGETGGLETSSVVGDLKNTKSCYDLAKNASFLLNVYVSVSCINGSGNVVGASLCKAGKCKEIPDS